jgi:hypothetical protein
MDAVCDDVRRIKLATVTGGAGVRCIAFLQRERFDRLYMVAYFAEKCIHGVVDDLDEGLGNLRYLPFIS